MRDENNSHSEDILKAIQLEEKREKIGHLKIFLGMAAGVGKTYAMLQEAQRLHRKGIDVQVGVIKTHERKETARLLEGLTIIPEKKLLYKGKELLELDVDEIIKRKPQIVLIDELAHTNVPGSRHEKRWQDVIEILQKGIDVYTTLNIQHIESLKDMIESIAQVPIKETVPDSIIEMATSIELIDLTTEELLQRLKDGKVYLGEQPQIAIQHFFKKDRLTALREIALRYAAEKIDYDLLKMIPTDRSNGFKPRERFLVVVTPDLQSKKLIRATRRLAFSLHAPWIALYVDDGTNLDEDQSVMLAKNLATARDLGAEVITTHDTDTSQGIKLCAEQKNVTQIILGHDAKRSFWDWISFKRSTVDRLTKECPEIDIHVIRLEKSSTAYRKEKMRLPPEPFFQYVLAGLCTFLICLLNFFLLPNIGYQATGFVFLLSVFLQSLFFKIGPLVFASIVSFLVWDYYFVPPKNSFIITSQEDGALVFVFFLIALTIGIWTQRIRLQKDLLSKREKFTLTFSELLQEIGKAQSIQELLELLKKRLEQDLNGIFEIFLVNSQKELDISNSSFLQNDNKEKNLVLWVADNGKEAGWSTSTLPESKNFCIPLKSHEKVLGVLTYRPKNPKQVLDFEEKNLLYIICQQIVYFLEREQKK